MKKINILYIVVIGVFFLLMKLNGQYAKHSVTFFGFAENKETQINMSHPVEVQKIHVLPGQEVKKGELLLEVSHASVDFKLDKVSYDLAELSAKEKLWAAELRSNINRMEAQKLNKYNEIQAKIEGIQTAMELNKSLVKDLKSVTIVADATGDANNPNQLKIDQLKKELESVVVPLDIEIGKLKTELNSLGNPYKVQMQKLENDQKYYEAEQEKLAIVAPTDGLIGNIHVKNAENLSSFATLITFYEEKPTLVEGYVHESLILQVALGDEIEVVSSLHPNHKCVGKVVGLGSRIVEVPERLRKITDFKTYGREVLISIPKENYFLQKEKVVLNVIGADVKRNTFLSMFE
jgi:multidrug resistance efflux pump